MSNERTETDYANDIEQAKQAESIVNHPLFIAAVGVLKEVTVEKFESLGFADVQQMQECNIRLNLIQEFEQNLSTVIQNGNAAFNALEDIQTFQQEIKNER